MVKEERWVEWKCPYCDSEYDTEDEAEDCADNCTECDPVEEVNKVEFICEMCDKTSRSYEVILKCEKLHIKNKDKLYEEYERIKEIKRMEKIANHKDQKKLGEYNGR